MKSAFFRNGASTLFLKVNFGFIDYMLKLLIRFQIKGLRIWKMQLLDEHHILIKYASEEVVTLRSSEPNAQVGPVC